MNKSYSELIKLSSYEDRLDYLRTNGIVGFDTFGHARYLNQQFYNTPEWKRFRRQIIIRDNACDLGLEAYPIINRCEIVLHHINPVTKEQILNRDPILFDAENVISCSHLTHMAIHYSKKSPYPKIGERKKNDTCPWRKDS